MAVDMYPLLFYVFAIVSLISAIGMITFKNPVYSILSLILTFISISGLYVLLNAQLLAIINIVVYAGAIMVLFIMIIMLINSHSIDKKEGLTSSRKLMITVGSASVIAFSGLFLYVYLSVKDSNDYHGQISDPSSIGLVEQMGRTLFTEYIFPFELTGILFLVALIGAVVLGKK